MREFGLPATVFNPALIETDAHVSSPVDGAIVLWNVADAEGGFSLRVLRPVGATGITYSVVGASAVAVSRDLGRHTFSTALPIKAGDTVALNVSGPSKIGFAKTGPSGMIAI